MQIHVGRNGQMLGQFEADAMPGLIQAGTVLSTDLYWHEGMAEWAAVSAKWSAAPAASPNSAPPLLAAAAAANAPLNLEAIAQASPEVMRGARWFWWIAGLSAVNTILTHSGSEMSFVIGLGFTLIADAAFHKFIAVALVIDVMAIGFFFGAGWFAGKGRLWAFVLGTLAYMGDTVIYLLVQEWRSLVFHLIALFFIIRGALALRRDVREARAAETAPAPSPAVNA